MASTELGHHEKRVYLHQDGHLVVPSSAKIVVEAGGYIREFGNPVLSITTTTGAALSNRGISIIKTTQITTHGIRAITKDVVGTRKVIIVDTSAEIKIRSSTAPNSDAIKFHSSCISIHQSTDLGKVYNKTLQKGVMLELLAYSTNTWYVLNLPFSTAGVGKGFVMATSTAAI